MTRTLATFRLPIPLDALDDVNEFVERVYGTGARVKQVDQFLQVIEPEEGLGERRTRVHKSYD